MTDPVLDSIDHVLHDWDVSADAMRWTPAPPVRTGPSYTDVTATMWAFSEAWRSAQDQFRAAVAGFAEEVRKVTVQLSFVLDWSQSEAETRRRSVMHSAYRRRRRTR